jgi:hypothetical protein
MSLVLAAHVRTFQSLPVLYSRPVGCVAVSDDPWAEFAALLITISAETLGAQSRARTALLLRARALAGKSGASISECTRSKFGWDRSRASLYRWSNRAAAALAEALNKREVPIPPELRGGATRTDLASKEVRSA